MEHLLQDNDIIACISPKCWQLVCLCTCLPLEVIMQLIGKLMVVNAIENPSTEQKSSLQLAIL